MSNTETTHRLADAQQDMFEDERRVERSAKQTQPNFIDPRPDDIFFGGQRLRAFLEEMDLQWVLEARALLRDLDWTSFEARYVGGGRAAYAPAAMMGLLLYGIMDGKSSLREVEQLARRDVGAMWMSGGIFPDHSVLGRFIERHEEELTAGFFERLTQTIFSRLKHRSTTLSGDGTVIESVSSRFQKIRLSALEDQVEKDLSDDSDDDDPETPGDPKIEQRRKAAKTGRKRVNNSRKTRAQKNATFISLTDPESVYLRGKRGQYAFGYVSSFLVDQERFIAAVGVDPSDEISIMPSLLDQAARVLPTPIERLLLDANYHRLAVFETAVERDIDLLCPSRAQSSGRRSQFEKQDFRYDDEEDVVICPENQRLQRQSSSKDTRTGRHYSTYRPESPKTCFNCPSRSQCTTSKRGRSIRRDSAEWLRESAAEVMRHPVAKRRFLERKTTVEPVIGQLRQDQSFNRMRRRGLLGAKLETALHASAYNLKRYARRAATAALAAFFTVWRMLSTLTSMNLDASRFLEPRFNFAVLEPDYV